MKHDFLYSVEREVKHSLDTLWRAFTDTDALQTWYHPTELNSVAGATLSEAHVDGKWQVAIEVPFDGSVHCFYGRYTSVEPKKYLEHTMHYTQSLEEFQRSFSYVWKIERKGDTRSRETQHTDGSAVSECFDNREERAIEISVT